MNTWAPGDRFADDADFNAKYLDWKTGEMVDYALGCLPDEVLHELDRIAFFAHNNTMKAGAEKERAVRGLRHIAHDLQCQPPPWVIEAYFVRYFTNNHRLAPERRAKDAAELYEGVLQHREFRDTQGRPIT